MFLMVIAWFLLGIFISAKYYETKSTIIINEIIEDLESQYLFKSYIPSDDINIILNKYNINLNNSNIVNKDLT